MEKQHTKYTVAVRIRPHNPKAAIAFAASKGNCVKQFRESSILTYSFDQVFEPQHTNQQIYQEVISRLVDSFLEKNLNTTILAYGQTGSGKTHTLFGGKSETGLATYIVRQVATRPVNCSFMQLYKEKPTDLITQQEVILRDNSKGELTYENLTVNRVTTPEQLLQLLEKANSNKIVGSSYVHNQSSRAHVLFRVSTEKAELNIVDLCGSQLLTYQFDEKQRQQTSTINLSLFTLNAVLADLCDRKSQKYIPFRNSVLTRVLKSSLIGRSQVYMFCTVSPEKEHQALSGSTLRFGQLAIQIDEAENAGVQKVNLSQQKRQEKKDVKVLQINPRPAQPQYRGVPWKYQTVTILGLQIRVYQILSSNPRAINLLSLHAYGGDCDGRDFSYFLQDLPLEEFNMYSVDFPGFGASEGKKFNSRAECFSDKGQALEFMVELFKFFRFSPVNKVSLFGYDLGGAIGLSSCMHRTLNKCISSVVAFHPTWTDSTDKLSVVSIPVLLVWVPVETFHLIAAGNKMVKVMKNCQMCKVVIGAYSNEKAAGLYDKYSKAIMEVAVPFIRSNAADTTVPQPVTRSDRGRIVEQSVSPSKDNEGELLTTREAVKEWYSIVSKKNQKQIYQTLIRGGEDKPKVLRMALSLPVVDPDSLTFDTLLNSQLIKEIPKNVRDFSEVGPLGEGRQLHIETTINLSVLQGDEKYLSYHPKGDKGITHKAFVAKGQTTESILSSGRVKVLVDTISGGQQLIQVSLQSVIRLNGATRFIKNVNGDYLFEDLVYCKYSSPIVRLKMAECLFAMEPFISKMDFANNTAELLDLQKKCTEAIFRLIDLRHLVHEGIDNTRYTGTDAGKLAYYGQGNCHHLASVMATFLLPFGRLLGWEVVFRAGSFLKNGRELDEKDEPLPNWNGKPNVNVEDHTWLEVVYKPSLHVTVFDPSFALCSVPLDYVYSRYGKMHISGRIQCSSDPPQPPAILCSSPALTASLRASCPRSQSRQYPSQV